MKRSLPLVDERSEPPVAEPRRVRIAGRLISIGDTGGGRRGREFTHSLVEAGATPVDATEGVAPDTRIVIRDASTSADARLRAEALEAAADLVLGSARPAFARLFASACARWVNS